ncbi:hypothetical protein HAX54_044785, partial [Datura stramonium]|nr:hypothetical protein [Datura stramonium]
TDGGEVSVPLEEESDGLASLFRPADLLSIFCQLSACSADLREFLSPGTTCLFSAAITVSDFSNH